MLVDDGRVRQENLRRERIAPEELAEQARLQQIGDLADVRWAILETGGKVSVIRR